MGDGIETWRTGFLQRMEAEEERAGKNTKDAVGEPCTEVSVGGAAQRRGERHRDVQLDACTHSAG